MDEYIGYYVRDEESYVKVYKRGNEEYHVVCALPKGGIEELERENKMNNNIEIFKNNEFGDLPILMINDREYFEATNVARVLGYKNPKDAIKRHCKKDGVVKHDLIDNLGRYQTKNFINEGNLYRLITHSKLPAAEKFEKWVFEEVLPSIRKNGSYQLPTNPMEILELTFQVQKEQNTRLNELDNDVKYLKDEVVISSSEYACIGNAVSQRVNSIQETYSLTPATKLCLRELYKAINHDIKRLTGAYTRSQIKRKDFAKVMEFIRIWTPDNVVNYKLKEMLNSN